MPRFCIADGQSGGAVFEDGIELDVVEQLRKMGHKVATNPILKGYGRMLFGRRRSFCGIKILECFVRDPMAELMARQWVGRIFLKKKKTKINKNKSKERR